MTPVKILVVDDEVELQRLIQQRFRRRIKSGEMNFIFASNGIEALRKLEQDAEVDMVLTDINMPEMDGLTFIQCLPQINEAVKAVVISAYTDMSRVRQAMNEGAFDFIAKPIDFQDLEQTIDKTLKRVQQLKDKQNQVRQFQEELVHAAFYDTLTGLHNRAWLRSHLSHILEQQKLALRQFVALLFIDLDGFKQINDTLGHLVGDAVLKSVAQRLKLCLRAGDLVVRLGGDEFVFILNDIGDISVAVAAAERVQNQLRKPFKIGPQTLKIGASIGIALSNKTYQDPEQLLQEADLAMYKAKAQGKDKYVIFNTIVCH